MAKHLTDSQQEALAAAQSAGCSVNVTEEGLVTVEGEQKDVMSVLGDLYTSFGHDFISLQYPKGSTKVYVFIRAADSNRPKTRGEGGDVNSDPNDRGYVKGPH